MIELRIVFIIFIAASVMYFTSVIYDSKQKTEFLKIRSGDTVYTIPVIKKEVKQ